MGQHLCSFVKTAACFMPSPRTRMGPPSKSTMKRNRFNAVFRHKPPRTLKNCNTIAQIPPSEIGLQLELPNNRLPTKFYEPDAPPPQIAFSRSKFWERDIAILYVANILEESAELEELVQLLASISDADDDDKFIDVLETCARFSVQLASALVACHDDARKAIKLFITRITNMTITQVNGGAQSSQMLTSIMENEISKIKVLADRFYRTLQSIAWDCGELSRLHPFWRYLQQNVHSINLQAIKTRLMSAIELFQTKCQINMQLDINTLIVKFDQVALNSLPNHPRYIRNEYLNGSRDDALEFISGWIDKATELALWVHGAAGLGKSTLAQQLVQLLKSDDRLAGGVFLRNLSAEHPETIIQMISRQLGEMHPRAIPDIAEVARRLDGPHGRLGEYFAAYFINPIRALKYPYPLVVVLDGLDEWENFEPFLAEFAHIPSPYPLKFVLFSRPNHSVERLLREIPGRNYPLRPVSPETVEQYFNHHFETIDWRGRKPEQRTINRLASRAQGLLVWAATVRSLVSHESDERYPHVILDQILLFEQKVGTQIGEPLECLYRNALTTLFPEPHIREMLLGFLRAMMALQEALSFPDFIDLIGIPDRPALEISRRLTALQTHDALDTDVILPAFQQFHASFLEFVEDNLLNIGHESSTSSINPHFVLANRCVGIVFSEQFQSRGGNTRSYSELNGAERYAVKYWPLHLSNGNPRLPFAQAATTLDQALLETSDEAMVYWATLFLSCISTPSQYSPTTLSAISKTALPFKLAEIIGKEDTTTISYHIHCLEVAVRFQPRNLRAWMALGEAYHWLYQLGGHRKNLDEGITAFLHALELISPNSTGKLERPPSNIRGKHVKLIEGPWNASGAFPEGDILSWLAYAFQTRFDQLGATVDLDRAVLLYREALVRQPHSHPGRSGSLNNLASALQSRFHQHGALKDLTEAILLHQDALTLRPKSDPTRSVSLNNLASALQIIFEQRGTFDDLDDAISLYREAVSLQPVPHQFRSRSLNNLASALQTRFEQHGRSNDLDEAVELHQEALALRTASHPHRAVSLNNLANALQARFKRDGASRDLDSAISFRREALGLRQECHPQYSNLLQSLAVSLRLRFERIQLLEDLDVAISLCRQLLDCSPQDSNRSWALTELPVLLKERQRLDGTQVTVDETTEMVCSKAIASLRHWDATAMVRRTRVRRQVGKCWR
ncbi:hypothetical protein GALMADRAFT_94379 [Galerina marginata CBS 339.88]|uniref:Nephrocystin 3-like N-terminal domain-containing protein n=1 Tax=Galerina marginata (strain CBS 339.88) TaxID=685588 RepID=A0A067TFY3_GALM3|nr:hypothetical protein GALMADRAFT_94379 [Galerina marginata CBS 339.88]